MDLVARLRERRKEIEQAALARVYAISDPTQVQDPEYVSGLRSAVTSGLDYGLSALAARSVGDPVPVVLLAQARYAARSGVSLDTVLRRYFSGYVLLSDFIAQAAESEGTSARELQRALRCEATLFDRLVASISEEYAREAEGHLRSVEERRAERVRMLLQGELVDSPELAYELDAWHIGVVAAGPGARIAIKDLAAALDRRPLVVCTGAGNVWAWLGGRHKVSARKALRLAETRWPADARLALGEAGRGIDGWRLTHYQAKAAIAVALLGPPRLVRYADAALLAAALCDDVLANSLREIYLAPLEQERDGGAVLRRTLAAYFATGRNASAAAAALGMSRNTVSTRLRSVEGRIGRPVNGCAAELETALRLRELARSY